MDDCWRPNMVARNLILAGIVAMMSLLSDGVEADQQPEPAAEKASAGSDDVADTPNTNVATILGRDVFIGKEVSNC